MKKTIVFLIALSLTFITQAKSLKNKKKSPKKEMTTEEQGGFLDLSSEIQQSVSDAKKTVTESRPQRPAKKAKKQKQILRVTGTSETVEVPDSVEWDHNRKSQNDQIKKLQKQMDKEPAQPIEQD